MLCYVCPHRCGVDRPVSINDTDGMFGCCGVGVLPVVSRAGVHMWEEPCLSGTRGAGTVFFTGCNLHCCYCQNYEISCLNKGKEISVARLKEIYHELIAKGVHNIDLVTPTHFAYSILQSLEEKLPVPVVYNSSGFEATDTLLKFEGKIQIWLPDLKYSDDMLALKYSNAYDYWNITRFKPGDVMFSLMHQYIPCGRASEYPELNRKVTMEEYKEVEDYLFASGIEDGFVQEEDSACGEFIPCFDGTGV